MLASNLLRVSVVMILIGLIMGVAMGASEDFRLMPAHAHLNLVGWVTMALFGLYYHLVPKAGEHWSAKLHFAVATAGILVMVPGIVLALERSEDTLAKIGSILTLVSMLIFVVNVWRSRAAAARAGIAASIAE
jgi:cbb3-type cytochrome oxidase subunit 1